MHVNLNLTWYDMNLKWARYGLELASVGHYNMNWQGCHLAEYITFNPNIT